MRALFIPLPQASESSLEGGIKRSISFRIGDLSNAASSHIEGVATGANGLPITSSLKQLTSEGDAGGDWIEGFGKNRERWHNCLYEEILPVIVLHGFHPH